MYEFEIRSLAAQIVDSQSLDYLNFQEAKCCIDVKMNGNLYFYEYDRITTTVYRHDCPNEVIRSLHSHIAKGLNKKISDKKQLYEYLALLRYSQYKNIEYKVIRKELRPDFVLIDNSGKRIGLEVTELTSQKDKKSSSITSKISHLTLQEAEQLATKMLGTDASDFKTVMIGRHPSLFPKNATCLTGQRLKNHDDLFKKYVMYMETTKIGLDFDSFIILGDALRSPVAITTEQEAEEILDSFGNCNFKHPVTIAIAFHNHSKNIFQVVENEYYLVQ